MTEVKQEVDQATRSNDWTRIVDLCIGAVMVVSSWLHLKNPMMFYLHVAGYKIIPVSVLPWFALTLPWLMLFAGMQIVLRVGHPVGPVVGAVIFGAFTIAQVWAILHGYDIDCGCFGPAVQKKIGLVSVSLPLLLAGACGLSVLVQRES